ncbi:unnamed protein product [Withania somnifera]
MAPGTSDISSTYGIDESVKRSFGRVRISMQTLSLLFSPPLIPLLPNPPILVFIASCNPISLIVCSAICFFSDFVMETGSWSCAE